jgi:branched-chain amino acid transport system permease protein
VPGAIFISFALALVEVAVQYTFSAKWGFPAMLLTAVIVLIWRPAGVFGREQIIRS